MDYTYHERLHNNNQIFKVIDELISNPDTRQAYISIYNAPDGLNIGKEKRIPCIIGYQFDIDSADGLNLTTILRSCDLQNCLANDIYLAAALQNHIMEQINTLYDNKISYEFVTLGSLTFMISNLHKYPKIELE